MVNPDFHKFKKKFHINALKMAESENVDKIVDN